MTRSLLTTLLVALATGGCGGTPEVARTIPAEVTVLGLPAALGPLERPAVLFNHDRHTRALRADGGGKVEASCQTCHPKDAKGRLSLRFGRAGEGGSRGELTKLYHDQCMGCHTERAARGVATGPVTCGECHQAGGPVQSARQTPRFDLALHFRHASAEKQACERCHHVLDAATRKLVYRKGTEEACAVCHGETDVGRRLSLRSAAHQSCVGCHLERERQHRKSGPVACAACHGGKVPSGLERPPAIGRLMRGQRDRLTVNVPGAQAGLVSFDHLGHEKTARFCTDCHHRSLSPCQSCHTLGGDNARGGGVSLDAAFHRPTSTRSCVGCHQQRTEEKSCAGCHQALQKVPSQHACVGCHQRPGPASTPAPARQRELSLLPAPSESFPDTVTIAGLMDEYGPSLLPHRTIAMNLDEAVRKSRLATAFHGNTDVLCAGCHHHSPPGQRPSPCRSCHSSSASPKTDRPSLKVAYHRQCLGCHAAMGLKQGCTDCHAKREDRR